MVLVPSHLSNGAFGPGITDVEAAWTYAGKPLPADRGETDSNNAGDAAHSNEPPGFVGTPYYLNTWSDPSISSTFGIPSRGCRDRCWPSAPAPMRCGPRSSARSRYAAGSPLHGKSDLVEMHIYPGAGHMVSRVGSGGPLSSFIFHPVAKDFEATGGLPNANCEGSYDAWQNVLQFLAKVKPARAGSTSCISILASYMQMTEE